MALSVRVEQVNGHYSASLLGDAAVQVDGPSRESALALLRDEVSRRMAAGELVNLNVPNVGIDFVGILKDDPTLEDLREEIARQRDLEPYPVYE